MVAILTVRNAEAKIWLKSSRLWVLKNPPVVMVIMGIHHHAAAAPVGIALPVMINDRL
jgi:hypothetical protein